MSTRLPSTIRRAATPAFVVAWIVISAPGCQLWPWGATKDRTTIITPGMRAASIREMGPRFRRADSAAQTKACEQLAMQIRTEPDPIVRRVIQETVAEFETPMATAMLIAGLNDDDRDVKVICARRLGERKESKAIGPLAGLVSNSTDLDVRLAAVDALGAMKTKEAIAGLAAALKDRDPAMQYAGVEAMKKVAPDQNLGNDVQAWRSYADSVVGALPAASIAAQPADTAVK
jgi:HEAT repeat protein